MEEHLNLPDDLMMDLPDLWMTHSADDALTLPSPYNVYSKQESVYDHVYWMHCKLCNQELDRIVESTDGADQSTEVLHRPRPDHPMALVAS